MKHIKIVTVKVFTPKNKSHKTFYLKTPNGTRLNPGGEDVVLKKFVDGLEEKFPYDEFALRQVGRCAFNFVWTGKRPIDEAAVLIGGMPLGVVSTAEAGKLG